MHYLNQLFDLYAKCGQVNTDRILFDEMRQRGVAWSSMISGYSRKNRDSMAYEALSLLLLN